MAEDPEIDFGTFLRKARERRGMSLQQVAATTKISARVLGALEQNDPSKLPGGIFARAFVRAYAREVGLDAEATVARFVTEFPDAASGVDSPTLVSGEDSESFESGRRVALTVLQLVGISILIVIAILIYLNTKPGSDHAPESASPVSSRDVPPSTASGGGVDGVPPDAAPVAAAQAPPFAGATSGVPLSLVIVAAEPCWVSLTADGREVISRLLDTGERVEFAAQASMTLKAGNAGALRLTLNGRPGRPFGSAGQVVSRTITPATLDSFVER